MKEKNIGKKLFMMALLCAVMITSIPLQKVNAVDKNFSITISRDAKIVSVSLPRDGQFKEVQVLNSSKKVWKTRKCSFFTSFNLKKNKAGTVRFRYIDNDGTALSDWSESISFATYTGNNVKKEGGKKLYASYKLPKIKGVKKYVIYISDKKEKGYKKIKSAKPGTKVVLKTFKKKSFKYYKNYYVRIKPIVTGAKNHAVCTTGFYFRKSFF